MNKMEQRAKISWHLALKKRKKPRVEDLCHIKDRRRLQRWNFSRLFKHKGENDFLIKHVLCAVKLPCVGGAAQASTFTSISDTFPRSTQTRRSNFYDPNVLRSPNASMFFHHLHRA